MSRSKSVLNMMMMSFARSAIGGIVFVLWGWSRVGGAGASGRKHRQPLRHFGLDGVSVGNLIFVGFQLTFAVITAALIRGAIADRVKFSSWLRVRAALA